jgi:hypothetical protein
LILDAAGYPMVDEFRSYLQALGDVDACIEVALVCSTANRSAFVEAFDIAISATM